MPIGREATDALRVEALCPWYGTGHRRGQPAPRDGPAGRALHSSTKGCYVGPGGDRPARGPRRQRQQGAARPAAHGAGRCGRRGDAPPARTSAGSRRRRSRRGSGRSRSATCTGATSRPAARGGGGRSGDGRHGFEERLEDLHEDRRLRARPGCSAARACPRTLRASRAYGDVDEANAVIGAAAALAAGPLAKLLARDPEGPVRDRRAARRPDPRGRFAPRQGRGDEPRRSASSSRRSTRASASCRRCGPSCCRAAARSARCCTRRAPSCAAPSARSWRSRTRPTSSPASSST